MSDFNWDNFKPIEDADSQSLYRTVQSIESAQALLLEDLRAKIQESELHLKTYGDLFARDEEGAVIVNKLGQKVSLINPIGGSKELEQLQALLKLKEDIFKGLRSRYEDRMSEKGQDFTDDDLRRIILGQK